MTIKEILTELDGRFTKIRNADAEIEAIYAVNPKEVEAVLTDGNHCYQRLLIAAWLIGRSETPDEAIVKTALDSAAELCVENANEVERVAKGLDCFGHVQGIPYFIDRVKTTSFDTKDEQQNEGIKVGQILKYATVLSNGKIPAVYRIYLNLFDETVNGIGAMTGDNPKNRIECFHRPCQRAGNAPEDLYEFIEVCPSWLNREYIIFEAAHLSSYGDDSELDKIIPDNMKTVGDLFYETNAMKRIASNDYRFKIARRLWDNGLGFEFVEIMLAAVRKAMDYEVSIKDAEQKEKFIAWLFGDTNEPVTAFASVIINNYNTRVGCFVPVLSIAACAQFITRLLEFGFFQGNYDVLESTARIMKAKERNDFLLRNGIDKQWLIDRYNSFMEKSPVVWNVFRDENEWKYLEETI
jgi:hypothetical protein